MIQAQGLCKSYDGTAVLADLDLEVRQGEIFAFVGPNGAGKSTFLKCVLGVVRADAGSIRVGEVDALRLSLQARRQIGYAPGETSLYQGLRADQFLRFAIAFHQHADLDRGLELLDAFGLPRRQRVKGFSHGMKRKLLLAQAFATRAPILMLDEPMEGLDPDARRLIESMLTEAAAQGRTVFFSSHDLASVERVADRVAFLRGGRILEIGTVEQILERASRVLLMHFREEVGEDSLPTDDNFEWSGQGHRWRLAYSGPLESVLSRLQHLPLAGIRDGSGRLEEVFEALYGPEDVGVGNPTPPQEEVA